jgi:hypothetical protein
VEDESKRLYLVVITLTSFAPTVAAALYYDAAGKISAGHAKVPNLANVIKPHFSLPSIVANKGKA